MLSKIIVHKVGNRINQESLILSQEELQLEDEMKELLEDFFLKAFKSEEQFSFYSDTYLVNNPVYSSVSEIFDDRDKFVYEAEKIVFGHSVMEDLTKEFNGKTINTDVKHGQEKNSES